MVTKRFVRSDEIEKQAINLASKIVSHLKGAGAFQTDPVTGKVLVINGQVQLKSKIWLIALWRGGCSYGVHIQGSMAMAGIKVDHVAIKTSSYTGVAEQSSLVKVHDLSYVADNYQPGDFLIIADDVFDGGLTAKTVVTDFQYRIGFDCPDKILVAVGFYKPGNSKVKPFGPNFVAEEVDPGTWLVFPHEYDDGLSDDELRQMVGDEKADALIAIRTALLD